jgi:hypothetical protein
MKYLTVVTIFLVALVMSMVACEKVTETGNPVEGPSALEQPGDEGSDQPTMGAPDSECATYDNEKYGVTLCVPDSWSVAEESEELVLFWDSASQTTTANIHFTRLAALPESFSAYINDIYPNRNVIQYDTGSYQGYLYDSNNVGEEGGDLKEYYFVEGDVFLKMEVESFPDGEDGLKELLSNIRFK